MIIDSGTVWKRPGGLTVAFRYYRQHKQLAITNLSAWKKYVIRTGSGGCGQGICFGGLTHGFAAGENPGSPPTVPPVDPSPTGTAPPPVPPPAVVPPIVPEGLKILSVDLDQPPRPSPPGRSITVTDDTRVNSSRPNKNYGAGDFLRVRDASSDWRRYLKFRVFGLDKPVRQASVRLYVTDHSNDGGSIFSVSNNHLGTAKPWSELDLTWELD